MLCDAFVCNTLGHLVSDVPYIEMAEGLNAGSAALESAELIAPNPLDEENLLQGRRPKICIGQGYRGKEGCAIGVGNCAKSLPGHPPSAAEMAEFSRENLPLL